MALRHSETGLPIVWARLSEVLAPACGMNIYRCTSVYINRNEVEPRLGTNIAVYARSITLTFSQIELQYTWGNPHQSRTQS